MSRTHPISMPKHLIPVSLLFLVVVGFLIAAISSSPATTSSTGEREPPPASPASATRIYILDRFEANLAVLIPDQPGDPLLVNRAKLPRASEGDAIGLFPGNPGNGPELRILPDVTARRRRAVRQLLDKLTAD